MKNKKFKLAAGLALAALLSGCAAQPAPAEQQEPAETAPVFDFESRTVMLNSGYAMPIMGLGTYSLDHDTCVNSVKTRLVLSRFLLRPGLCSMECPE